MRTTPVGIAIALPLALGGVATSPARAGSDDAARAFALALLALGVGVAIGKPGSKPHVSQWDQNLYGEPFSPADGVICLPRPSKCYAHGNVSYRWTNIIFG